MSLFTPATLWRGLAFGALVVAWAALAHYGSAGDGSSPLGAALATAPLVAIVVVLLWRVGHPLWPVAGGLAVVALLAWNWPTLRQNLALLYYGQHLATNLALAVLFGRSLAGGGEALVSRFARLAENKALSPVKLRYTRQVTLAWTLFFVANAAVSTLLFWLAPAAAWSVFANLLATPLVGLMFAAEHLVRHRVLPPEERTGIAATIRGYRAAMRRPAGLAKQP